MELSALLSCMHVPSKAKIILFNIQFLDTKSLFGNFIFKFKEFFLSGAQKTAIKEDKWKQQNAFM